MDVSVIIVNYKTSGLIADCVRSILDKTEDVDYEVIIIDNNSEPDFQATISESLPHNQKHRFHFIPLQENIGFGRANNEGLRIAKGRNIFFLNPDTILLNNAIKILSDFLDSTPKAGACGGNLVDGDLYPAYSYKKILPGLKWEINELFNNKLQILFYGKTNSFYNTKLHPVKVGYITGADLMVKKQTLDKTGAFSPEFFMYYEETDLCARIRKNGLDIYNIPSAKIQHLESKSFSTSDSYQSDFKTRLIEESRQIYYKRNHGRFISAISNLIYRTFLTSRILLVRNKAKNDYYHLRLKYFKNSKK